MIIMNNLIQVEELTDDLLIDGILQKYDDTNQYMFAKVIYADQNVLDVLRKYSVDFSDIVLVFKRPAKVPFLGSYLVSFDDILVIMTSKEYDKYTNN